MAPSSSSASVEYYPNGLVAAKEMAVRKNQEIMAKVGLQYVNCAVTICSCNPTGLVRADGCQGVGPWSTAFAAAVRDHGRSWLAAAVDSISFTMGAVSSLGWGTRVAAPGPCTQPMWSVRAAELRRRAAAGIRIDNSKSLYAGILGVRNWTLASCKQPLWWDPLGVYPDFELLHAAHAVVFGSFLLTFRRLEERQRQS
eukprot:scaffold137317_cov16-Tisochrysis_lutea.AAC.1